MLGGDLLAESVHLLFGEPAFEEGARINAGGGVALEEHVVTAAWVILPAEEVVEANLVQGRYRRVRREVAANANAGPLGAHDLNGSVPAHPAAVLALGRLIAGEVWFLINGNGVDVGGGEF